MILVDLSQVMISTLMVQIGFSKDRESVDLNEHFLRHLVLNTLRSYKKKYGTEYGEMVICADSKSGTLWRKQFFPYYKALRARQKEAMGLDWPVIFAALNKIKDEIREFLPYKLLEVEGCEADDIIATLTERFKATEKVLILSSDRDFIQLQAGTKNVRQWSPRMQVFVTRPNPLEYMKEHIIKGEPAKTGDGIPNIMSPDDTFLNGGRKNLPKGKLEQWLKQDPAEFCTTDTMKRGWARNETLVDLTKIPDEYKSKINDLYDVPQKTVLKKDIMHYFMSRGLRNLINMVDEF